MLSNWLPCIWKAKPRGLYNQANIQTNWNYNGMLEYIPWVVKPQWKKISSTKLQGTDWNPQKLGNMVRSDWKLVLTSPLRKRVESRDNTGCFLVGPKHIANSHKINRRLAIISSLPFPHNQTSNSQACRAAAFSPPRTLLSQASVLALLPCL